MPQKDRRTGPKSRRTAPRKVRAPARSVAPRTAERKKQRASTTASERRKVDSLGIRRSAEDEALTTGRGGNRLAVDPQQGDVERSHDHIRSRRGPRPSSDPLVEPGKGLGRRADRDVYADTSYGHGRGNTDARDANRTRRAARRSSRRDRQPYEYGVGEDVQAREDRAPATGRVTARPRDEEEDAGRPVGAQPTHLAKPKRTTERRKVRPHRAPHEDSERRTRTRGQRSTRRNEEERRVVGASAPGPWDEEKVDLGADKPVRRAKNKPVTPTARNYERDWGNDDLGDRTTSREDQR